MDISEMWIAVFWIAPGVIMFVIQGIAGMSGDAWLLRDGDNMWWLFIWPLVAILFFLVGIGWFIGKGLEVMGGKS